MKPYHQIPILECGEPLVPIPSKVFVVQTPHPYQKLSAPYGLKSPYYLRQGVIKHLKMAQDLLQKDYSGWRIQIVDAYRPIPVQEFMVNYTFEQLVREQGLYPHQLSPEQHQAFLKEVHRFWAVPSRDPAAPPPHSTGAAVDVTLLNAKGEPIDMGSPIDEISHRSHPDYFSQNSDLEDGGNGDRPNIAFHRNRQVLRTVMVGAGFRQHPNEWWHFSYGDQMWAWLMNIESPETMLVARYGAT